MKAVIPAAGRGTRLYPQTLTKPKVMVRLAGKPLLGHILDRLIAADIEDVVVVVGGELRSQITEYATEAYGDDLSLSFPEQEVARGLGHSIYQAREDVAGDPILVVLSDMLFVDGYESFLDAHQATDAAGTIGVREVTDPQNYGVVELGADDRITRLAEKPKEPKSNYAISGLYAVDDTPALFGALEALIEAGQTGAGGEFQLTDALQRMLEAGVSLAAAEVDEWYDCGRSETLLDANAVLLDRRGGSGDTDVENGLVIPPVDIGRDVTIESSIVGPHVSIDRGTEINHSIVSESIVGSDSTLTGINVERSLVGDSVLLSDTADRLNVGANSRVEF
ncbi:sugar phosphate nucleotidyltransferase [Halocalculus aciditolerans]|uniref:Glucose-1-phosphate thymidylyltransferase n=1 Tax=Halocalculus aciditolerans TaxID=1383812 RepID=A0A830F2E6_9EURY|nr:sugar phosphate nucleotidyltransferase [Halocalculus aciditolerans]GGL55892.1 glucose-1-phosphate thymidylyltransferase [Halocalculus aciditolerans]